MTINGDILYDQSADKAHPLEKDPYGRYGTMLAMPHHQIHEGNGYRACVFTADLDTNGVFGVSITVGSIRPHMLIDIDAINEAGIVFLEGVTQAISSSNIMSLVNKDRNSSKTSTVSMHYNPTISVSGTVLLSSNYGDGKKSGADVSARDEWILKTDTSYNVSVTSGAENNKVNLTLEWYEKNLG